MKKYSLTVIRSNESERITVSEYFFIAGSSYADRSMVVFMRRRVSGMSLAERILSNRSCASSAVRQSTPHMPHSCMKRAFEWRTDSMSFLNCSLSLNAGLPAKNTLPLSWPFFSSWVCLHLMTLNSTGLALAVAWFLPFVPDGMAATPAMSLSDRFFFFLDDVVGPGWVEPGLAAAAAASRTAGTETPDLGGAGAGSSTEGSEGWSSSSRTTALPRARLGGMDGRRVAVRDEVCER